MDDDASARIDRRLEITEEYVRQGAEQLPRIAEYIRLGNEHMQDARAASERQSQAIEDGRLALNQMNLRSERIMRQMLAELAELRASTQEMTASIREWRYEGVEEARAQRTALFAILDQLRGGAGPATA